MDNIIERIKTFEDACEWCLANDKSHLVAAYQSICESNKTGCEDVEAYLKLRIICTALNEGWQATSRGEERYNPWFESTLWEEFDELDEKDKKEITSDKNFYPAKNGYLMFGGVLLDEHGAYLSYGKQIALKSEEIAEYCGKQFIDVWARFMDYV